MAAEDTTQIRRPFTGSCHCGYVKYVVYLNIPNRAPGPDERSPMQVAYRCNCTACHKMGILHLRLRSAPDDFALLSPLDPFSDLSDYQCDKKNLHWLFCKTCGVRCFSFMGAHELADDELPGYGAEGERFKFWRPAKDQFLEGKRPRDSYLSVNAITLDADQEGADLIDWADRKAISYVDALGLNGKPTGGIANKPFEGGCY
ncbi:hypothetical protein GQ53DRAFT_744036 [Thozetella sp. PMI_491]|nr:hypothetical protein GQ53DRAFT_744036 [Thozetella sp. PMI_491]